MRSSFRTDYCTFTQHLTSCCGCAAALHKDQLTTNTASTVSCTRSLSVDRILIHNPTQNHLVGDIGNNTHKSRRSWRSVRYGCQLIEQVLFLSVLNSLLFINPHQKNGNPQGWQRSSAESDGLMTFSTEHSFSLHRCCISAGFINVSLKTGFIFIIGRSRWGAEKDWFLYWRKNIIQ